MHGSMVPSLGVSQWLKLELFRVTSFSKIVYLDADTLITSNVDELFSLTKFAGVGDYFAGAVFVVVPSVDIYRQMMAALEEENAGLYLYGEQDFLNDFFSRYKEEGEREVLLRSEYHCLAEDFGHEHRLTNPTNSCKIVEFASCDRGGGGGVRGGWKPWQDEGKLRGEGKLVCRLPPTEMFWELVRFWRSMYGWMGGEVRVSYTIE